MGQLDVRTPGHRREVVEWDTVKYRFDVQAEIRLREKVRGAIHRNATGIERSAIKMKM